MRTKERNHIKAQFIRTNDHGSASGAKPLSGQPSNAGLLRTGYGFKRRPELVGRSGLDLAEDERGSPAEHEIQLAVAAMPVPVEDLVAAKSIPLCGRILAMKPYGSVAG
jgi:hypothetical protein